MACYHPIEIDWRILPCGNCLGCRANQARDWAFRIMHETQEHESSWFVTLTYANERMPENGSLDPEDLRTFVKTLRRQQKEKLSYYACGEYGETTQRPHYHSVLYGPRLLDKSPLRNNGNYPVWRSPTLESCWPHGHSEISTVTTGSASYVAGYVRKKISKRAKPEAYTRVDPETGELVELKQEFSRMSRRPAIAKRWIEKYWTDVYPNDYVVMQGKEFKPPRYYDKWMEIHQPEIMIDVKMERDARAIYIPPEKLAAKEKIHQARTELYQTRGNV